MPGGCESPMLSRWDSQEAHLSWTGRPSAGRRRARHPHRGAHQALRRDARPRRPRPQRRRGRGLRLPRPQRCRQDDDDPAAARAAPADAPVARELFGIDCLERSGRRSPAGRLRRGRAVPVAGADERGDVRVPRAGCTAEPTSPTATSSSSASSSTPRRRSAPCRRATARRCSWSPRSLRGRTCCCSTSRPRGSIR